MAKTLTIQFSDDLERQLSAQAEQLNLSLEDFIMQSLAQSDTSESDPILPLLGTLRFELSDLGKNHDKYLSQTF